MLHAIPLGCNVGYAETGQGGIGGNCSLLVAKGLLTLIWPNPEMRVRGDRCGSFRSYFERYRGSRTPLAPSALPHNTRCCLQSGQHSHKSSSRYTAFVSNDGTAG